MPLLLHNLPWLVTALIVIIASATRNFWALPGDAARTKGTTMTEHDLKCTPGHFQALWDGTKTAELRNDDRGYAVGDTLLIREWRGEQWEVVSRQGAAFPLAADPYYTGRILRRRITHIVRGGPWLCDGYVMLSLGADLCRKKSLSLSP